MALSYLTTHQPQDVCELLGQDAALQELDDFITNFKTQKKKAALLYGPPGCGKTIAAILLAKKYQLELIEINASDQRNAGEIETRVGEAIKQQSLFCSGKLILIDEVDSLSGTKDRGGLGAIKDLLPSSTYPIILTANEIWDNKFSSLRSASRLIKFTTPDHEIIAKGLARICAKESILATPQAIRELAKQCSGDFRAAINDLQGISQQTKRLELEALHDLSHRDKLDSMISALLKLFTSTTLQNAKTAFENVAQDPDEIFSWIVENLPYVYTDAKILAAAYESLSKADVYRGRILRQQYWRFLVYKGALETAGVRCTNNKPSDYTIYKQPQRGLAIWRLNLKYQKRKEISQKLADKMHLSRKRVLQDVLPYIRFIAKQDIFKTALAKEFELDKEEITWLTS
ncbi:MAG: replication factor C large subunit [Nanoarchaeota archaeon]